MGAFGCGDLKPNMTARMFPSCRPEDTNVHDRLDWEPRQARDAYPPMTWRRCPNDGHHIRSPSDLPAIVSAPAPV